MCNGNTEDVPHLLDVSSAERFWSSCGRYEGQGALVLVLVWAVLLAIWLPRNECIFKGRGVSLDGVLHEVEGLLVIWAGGR